MVTCAPVSSNSDMNVTMRRTSLRNSVFRVTIVACCPLMVPMVLREVNAQSSLDGASIAAKVSPAVVLIKGESSDGSVVGSGIIVSPDGKIATNLHVIRDLRTVVVQLANGEIFATVSVLAFDDRKDLAIVKIAGFDLPTVLLGNSNEVRAGERVVVIGSFRGLQGTVTSGVISAIRDEPSGAGFKLLQTDASVNPGNSGGPLLNDRAQVIGVVTWKWRGSEGLNFAVPVNYLRGMLDDLNKPMSLDELRTNLHSTKTDVFNYSDYPALWKSLASGILWKVRFQGDFISAEGVLSEDVRRRLFIVYELKKDGDSYKGINRRIFTCNHRCTLEFKAEFTSVTPVRIEGRIFTPPEDAKFDCKKCSYSKAPVWQQFVWIPQ